MTQKTLLGLDKDLMIKNPLYRNKILQEQGNQMPSFMRTKRPLSTTYQELGKRNEQESGINREMNFEIYDDNCEKGKGQIKQLVFGNKNFELKSSYQVYQQFQSGFQKQDRQPILQIKKEKKGYVKLLNFMGESTYQSTFGQNFNLFSTQKSIKAKKQPDQQLFKQRNPIVQCLPFYDGRGKFSDKLSLDEYQEYAKLNQKYRQEVDQIKRKRENNIFF